MADVESKGACELCAEVFGRAGMSRHLATCLRTVGVRFGEPAPAYRLLVKGGEGGRYWLQVVARQDASLASLDALLRTTWLECCGHMSFFESKRGRFLSDTEPLFGDEPPARGFDVPLSLAAGPGSSLRYEYDMGSTTRLGLRVVDELVLAFTSRESCRIVARNDAPALACSTCRKPALHVCTQCQWEGDAAYCDTCLDAHECGRELALGVMNSPRMGVCAYGA